MKMQLQNKSKLTGITRKVSQWLFTYPFRSVLIYLCAVSAFFLVFPDIDLWASGLFYDEVSGFAAQNSDFLRQVRHLGPHIVTLIAIFCLLALVLKLVLPGRAPLLPLRKPVYLLTTLILGPGIVVNAILKDNWGRPRPRSVEEFGGDLVFQKVWIISDQCDRNCSFTSGEASAAMWLVAAVAVLPRSWWKYALAAALPLGLILSVNRVAFGGHFLSDTLLSWGLTLLIALTVHRVLYFSYRRFLHDRHLDERFTRIGRFVHRGLANAGTRLLRSSRRFVKMFREN